MSSQVSQPQAEPRRQDRLPPAADRSAFRTHADRPELDRLTAVLQAALERSAQLERALESRIVIEQAKGVLVERLRVEPDVAFGLLRRAARNSRRKLHDLAHEVVHSRVTPPEVAGVLADSDRISGRNGR